MLIKITRAVRYLGQSMRLMVGVPEYSTYVDHMKTMHPDQPVMSYREFFRERQEARYGGNGKISRCC
ncbi:YbdD/YjiX family protein [Nitrosovibrio sp. Nv4]|uniref:YbdD/YjiX family protein n=1 Tax=Nitrosovibrio sp. Nv4 TaxID=1945880 RepID=UPI000BE25FC1|nr:YbdD/YjiX family protein [Nitrosovibrio sp. Nv4]